MAAVADGASDPDDLAAWELHCYCPNARQTPHRVVTEGNNGKVLYAARDGATREHLAVTDAQLATLLKFRLLAWDDGRLRTAFPMVGSSAMTALRSNLRELARKLTDAIEDPARMIGAELDRRGIGYSGYALVFGYALDLLLWEPLKRTGVVPETALTRERPRWNGAFWAIHPPREGSSGTNFLDCGDGVSLVMVWSVETAKPLHALATTPGIRGALRSLIHGGAGQDRTAATVPTGGRWRLRLPDGRPALPIVGTGGPLDDLAGQIAEPVAALLAGGDTDAARAFVPTRERAVATVVVAHELIWEVTDQLIARGACRVPSAGDDLTGRMFLLGRRRDGM